MTDTIVWSKDYCPYCDQAKLMLKRAGVPFEERNITSGGWTKEQLLEELPDVRTVPQIYMHGEYVGDFNALCRYFEDHNMFGGNPSI